jgi:hypothetical protein
MLIPGVFIVFFSLVISVAGCKSNAKSVTYTSDIGTLLTKRCVGCHNPNGSAKKIPLDNYDNVKATVKPGNASGSRLIKAVDGGRMRGRASEGEVDLLKKWVNQGAPK